MRTALFLLRRVSVMLPVLLGMSLLVFLLVRMIPGDPAQVILGLRATPEKLVVIREQLGLHRPWHVQYITWLGQVLRGDFGMDLRNNQPINQLVSQTLPVTLQLGFVAMLMSLVLAIPLGLLSAARRGTAERVTTGLGVVGISIPDFWLGIMLVLFFSLRLGWFPSSAYVPFSESPVDNLRHLFLPAFTLATGLAAVTVRMLHGSLLEVLGQDFIRFLRAKGLRERTILLKHALRNAAIPVVTVIGMQLGYLLGGTVLVEQLFALPGIGKLTLAAVLERNYTVVQACLLVVGGLFMLINIATDAVYGLINPRISFDSKR